MSFELTFSGETGLTLTATLQRLDNLQFWNKTLAVFQVSPAYVDKKFVMVEGTAENLGSYMATINQPALGSPGLIIARFHDEGQSNLTIGLAELDLQSAAQLGFTSLLSLQETGISSTVQAVTDATTFTGAAPLVATNDFYNSSLVEFTSGTLLGTARPITDYVGVSRTIIVSPAFPVAPSISDGFVIRDFEA